MAKPKAVGIVMTECREHRHMSVADAGATVGVSHSLLTKWEAGERLPSVGSIRKWAKGMRLSHAEVSDLAVAIIYGSGRDGRPKRAWEKRED